jgi:5'(3')-deoxyribonucleotidase
MTKELIGFDLDGVLYSFHDVFYRELVAHDNLKMGYTEFWKAAEGLWNGDSKYHNLTRLPHLFTSAVINSDNLRTLWKLSKMYDIIYITKRQPEIHFWTGQWLKKSGVPFYENYLLTDNKLVTVEKAKCGYYVEDRAIEAQPLSEITTVFMVRQPWNLNDRNGYTCIDNLQELEGILL